MNPTNTNLRFPGKQALVSGGGSGIGRAVALALANEGATVRIVGRNEKSLQQTAILSSGKIIPVCCDISDSQQWCKVIGQHPIDILINNAAVSLSADILAPDEQAWSKTFSINFEGTRQGCLAAARIMREQKNGRIVNLTSVHGQICEYNSSAYGIAKAAINQLTRCLAIEMAQYNVLVNAVAPGFVDTPMSRASGVNELETEWFQKNFVDTGRLPLRRPAQPEEIAPAVLFLASDANTYITGQVLTVDGGLTLTL